MTADWTLTQNASLQDRNTFHLPATAPWLLEISNTEALETALALPSIKDQPLLLLGGGSNILFVDNPEGVVLNFTNESINILEHRADYALVRVSAGRLWHELVMWSLSQGLSGLENLALIPGTAGAAPVQNIGAYGAQISEFIETIEAYDRQTAQWIKLNNEECQFGYRSSLFKLEPERYIIGALELRLPWLSSLRLDYPGINQELERMGITAPTSNDIANAVINLRNSKLPDPTVIGNAGSFFKNPLLSKEQAKIVQQQYPELPSYLAEDKINTKLSAAWMIETCGWKGYREGDIGVSSAHALVLINYGQATGKEVLTLARQISASVLDKFGVAIEPEPKIIGAQW